MENFKKDNNLESYINNYEFSYDVMEYEFNWELHKQEREKFLAKGNSEEMWFKITIEVLRADYIMLGLYRYYSTFDEAIIEFINKKGLYDGKAHLIEYIRLTHLKFGHNLAEQAANDLMNNGKADVQLSDTAGCEISISNGILIFENKKTENTYTEQFEIDMIIKEIVIWYYSTINHMFMLV